METTSLQINLLKRLKLKRIIVIVLVVMGLGAEAMPEQLAKLITVPCLVSAIVIEAVVGE